MGGNHSKFVYSTQIFGLKRNLQDTSGREIRVDREGRVERVQEMEEIV
jgi:hypothetical protein